MSRWYIDSSAAAKLLTEEAESAALAGELDAQLPELVACFLLETELRRLVNRRPELTHTAVTHLLDRVSLYDVPPTLFREAGLLPGDSLRSLDALRLAAAVRLGADVVLSYDRRMIGAAEELGFAVVSPGPQTLTPQS